MGLFEPFFERTADMLYLDIFDKSYLEKAPRTGVSTQRDIEYIKRLCVFNKDAIEEYYLSRNFAVKNTHILSRLLTHFTPHLNYEAYEYLEYVDRQVSYLAKHFKFTSESERGVLHPPHFFGNEGSEVIFYGYEPLDAYSYVNNWRRAPCVRVLSHPRDDSQYLLPLGTNDGNRGGLSSLYVDLRRLALKYREFVREQVAAERTGGMVLSKNHFVIKHVLPSMMGDVIDHTLLNRVINAFYDQACTEPSRKYPFMTFKPDTQVDRYVSDTLAVITGKSMSFLEMLRHIKLVFAEDAADLLTLPDMYSTRQLKPGLVATRVDYMLFLLRACKNKNESKQYMNDWKRFAQRTLNDNGLANFFDYQTEQSLKTKLQELADI